MFQNKKWFFTVLKWLIMFLAYGYLIYKLANIKYWNELKLSFEAINLNRFFLLAGVLVLMPLNLALETKKWQILTRKTIKFSFSDSLKSVLAGLNTGFITPGRVGEFAGRIIYFPSNLRLSGTLLSFVNGFIQTLVMTVFGLVSTYFYTLQFKSKFEFSKYLLSIGIIFVAFIGVYFLFPTVFKKLKEKKWALKLQNTLKFLSELSYKTLVTAFLISVLRFVVFCSQYYLLLWFFKVELTPEQALIGIPTMYLLITYAPTLAASEVAVRASIAVLVLSVFSNNEIGILLTGILIWLINFIVPMVVGSVFVVNRKTVET